MGHSTKPITIGQIRTVKLESIYMQKVLAGAYTTQVLNPWYLQKNLIPPAVAHSTNLEFEQLGEFETKFVKMK
jgi:hypothetical protein